MCVGHCISGYVVSVWREICYRSILLHFASCLSLSHSFIHFLLYLSCVYMCTVPTWRSEDIQWVSSLLLLCGSWGLNLAIRFGSKCPYPLSHFSNLVVCLFILIMFFFIKVLTNLIMFVITADLSPQNGSPWREPQCCNQEMSVVSGAEGTHWGV